MLFRVARGRSATPGVPAPLRYRRFCDLGRPTPAAPIGRLPLPFRMPSRPQRVDPSSDHSLPHAAVMRFGTAGAQDPAPVRTTSPRSGDHGAPNRVSGAALRAGATQAGGTHGGGAHGVAAPLRTGRRRLHATHAAPTHAAGAAVLRVAVDAPPEPPVWRAATKRAVDIVGALLGLALSTPLLLLLAPLLRLEAEGSILFGQARVGRGGRIFRCYKLRTMCADAETQLVDDPALRADYEANGFKLPAGADHRVTPFGRLLRVTSVDEIPQFWNVLRGDMSLVGPRPIVPNELSHYARREEILLSVRPGLTGAWAVRGRSRIGYPERAAIELEYVQCWTLWGDLAILARTIIAVLQRRGAY